MWRLLTLIASPFVVVVVICCIFAAFGRTVGIRRWYTNLLLRVFEYGTKVQRAQAANGDASSGDFARSSTSDHSLIERDMLLNADGTLNLDTAYIDANDPHAKNDQATATDGKESLTMSASASAPKLETFKATDAERHRRNFQLYDAMYFMRAGVEAIIEDEVTKRFAASELASWNMLTRTSTMHFRFSSMRLGLLWWLGFIIRWFILLPFRLAIMATGLVWIIGGSYIVGFLPRKMRRSSAALVLLSGMRLLARCFSAVITFHDIDNRPVNGFCVANHTSPIDVIIMGYDRPYSMIGQRHGGLMGLLQWAFSRATQHIWFERSDSKDRNSVTNMMREHVKDPRNLPVLIFPEGTCINNTTVMLFRKGAFEIEANVYPAAVKYDPRFADPFWNSSADGMIKHLLKILTSWAIVADVWYLPKQNRAPEESSAAFADRVRTMIARAGGLVELDWDGQLKRSKPRPELRQRPQQVYAHLLKTD